MDKQVLERQQKGVLEQMQQILTMYRGTLSEQRYPERQVRKEGAGATGPYSLWQGSVNGKHFSRRVNASRAKVIEEGIKARHRFEQLCTQYVELSEARAMLESGDPSVPDALKTPRSLSRKTRR